MDISDYDRRKNIHVLISLGLVLIIWVVTIALLVTELYGYTSEYNMFGRAGSLLTLFAVILEYNIGQKLAINVPIKPEGGIGFGRVGEAVERAVALPTDKRRQLVAHITVVFGTLIWGFGDLINHAWGS